VCFWHFSNNTAPKPKPKDAKSPTHQVSVVFLRNSENEPPREAHILTLTIRAHRFQKPHPHKPQPNQAKSTTHQVSDVCFGHFSNNTASKPKPKDAKSPTHQVSVVFLRISENEPPREAHILTMTTRAHPCQNPHPHTNHNPIRPRAPPTKFPMCALHCSNHTAYKPKPKDAKSPTHQVSVVFFCEFQKTNHRERLTSSP
jgi:hypothetical protein